MDKSGIKKTLEQTITAKYILCHEYQDKYFVYKSIQEAVPELAESRIYEALDKVNLLHKPPVKKKIFIDTFTESLDI